MLNHFPALAAFALAGAALVGSYSRPQVEPAVMRTRLPLASVPHGPGRTDVICPECQGKTVNRDGYTCPMCNGLGRLDVECDDAGQPLRYGQGDKAFAVYRNKPYLERSKPQLGSDPGREGFVPKLYDAYNGAPPDKLQAGIIASLGQVAKHVADVQPRGRVLQNQPDSREAVGMPYFEDGKWHCDREGDDYVYIDHPQWVARVNRDFGLSFREPLPVTGAQGCPNGICPLQGQSSGSPCASGGCASGGCGAQSFGPARPRFFQRRRGW